MNRTATRTAIRVAPALVLSLAVVGSATVGSAVAAKMITGQDIKNGSIASIDVKNGSLTGKDVAKGSLGESKLGAGVRGKLNAPSVAGYEVVTATLEVTVDTPDTAFVRCSAGKVAVGGGGGFTSVDQALTLQASTPYDFFEETNLYGPAKPGLADAWGVSAYNGLANPENLTVYAICVDPS